MGPAPAAQAEDPQAGGITAARSFDAAAAVALIYAGRSDSTLALVATEEAVNPYDPLVPIVKARAMRDQLPDEDDNKSLIGDGIEPILAVLDQAIKLCDQAIDQKANDPVYEYYKGRAYLSKAQLHVLTRSYWSAAQDSRKAKKYLENYLEINPDHADASGDLGAFLYFADTLPGVVKFLGKLLLLPSGDRDRGLRLLEYASTHDGIFTTDYLIARAAINLLFEGRVREGTNQMLDLMDRYPGYTRLAEPLGVLAPLDPLRMDELLAAHDAAIDYQVNSGRVRYDDSLVKRMRGHSAYAELFFGTPAAGLQRIDELIADPPQRPDWALPLWLVNRGMFRAMEGRVEEAREDYERVIGTESMEHFHDISKTLRDALDQDVTPRAIEDLAWVAWIYKIRVKEARAGLAQYESKYGHDVVYLFYAGELAVVEQDFETARRDYEQCLAMSVVDVDQYYQFFACLRLAEIHGHQFRYKMARDFYDKAGEYRRATYLIDFLINSRKRYYELLEDGVIAGPPRLLYYPGPRQDGWASPADSGD